MSFIDWLGNIVSKAAYNVTIYVICLCYGLWYVLNKACFEGKNLEVVHIVQFF